MRRRNGIWTRTLAAMAITIIPACAWANDMGPCVHQGQPVFCPHFQVPLPAVGASIPIGSVSTLVSPPLTRWRLGNTNVEIFLNGTMFTAFTVPVVIGPAAPPPVIGPTAPPPVIGPIILPDLLVRDVLARTQPLRSPSDSGALRLAASGQSERLDLVDALNMYFRALENPLMLGPSAIFEEVTKRADAGIGPAPAAVRLRTSSETQVLAAQGADDAVAYNASSGDLWKGMQHFALQKPAAPAAATPRARMERFYTAQTVGYTQQLHALGTQLDAAKQDKKNAQQKLDAYLKGQDWLDYLGGVLTGDPEAEWLAKQVAAADQRIALVEIRMGATQQALDNTIGLQIGLSRRLDLEAIKADPNRLAQEQGTRYDALIAANQDFATKRAQFRAGDAQFKALLAGLDGLINTFKTIGQPETAAAFEKQKEAVQDVYGAWTAGMRTASANRAGDINRLYAQNAADGIGPANNSALLAQMGAYSQAGDPRAIVTLVDKAAVKRAAGSAFTIGASVSIGDPHAYTKWDFAADTARTYFDAYRDPKTFVLRNVAYWKGVGGAVKDGVTEIVGLVVSVGDLAGESIEAALGIDTGLFGKEESEALQKLLQGAAEMDANTLYGITDSLITKAERRLEQHAGAGEKGIRAALSDTGYVVGTVAGAEELAFKALAYAGKLRALAQSLRAAGKTDEAAQATALAKVYDKVAESARSGEAATPPSGATVVDGGVVTLPEGPPAGGQPTAATIPAARGPPVSPSTNLVTGADGKPLLVRGTDGREYAVGERIGRGATSEVYAVPGERLIVKITDGTNRLDQFGADAIQKIDPSMNAKLIDQQVIDGKTVSVFERADPYSATRKAQAEAAGVAPGSIDMTPGQIRAYREGMEKLNANGLAWFDSKPNNYSFVPIDGKTDEFRLVIIDPGGIVPMKSADAARQAQRFIDSPDESFVDMLGTLDPQYRPTITRDTAIEEFGGMVDTEKLNQATGLNSLGQVPFNAENGLHSPGLRTAARGDVSRDPFRDAPTQRDFDAEDDIPTSPPREMTDSEYENYLRRMGLTEEQIRRNIDAEPVVPLFPGDRPFGLLREPAMLAVL